MLNISKGLSGQDVRQIGAQKMANRIVKTYDYRDESGELLYQNCRYVPKTFRQRRPNGEGWIWNLNGTRRVLYRLQELLRADPEQWVFCVEGEKDADNLIERGFIATTAGAAHNWKTELAEFLSDRKVCVLHDNDLAGEKLAERVVKDCRKVGCPDVRRVDLPDAKEKEDVSDWLNDGGTKEKLLELVEQAGKSDVKLNLINMADVEAEPVEWLWPNKIPACAITIISGDPGATKSYLTTYMAAQITTGKSWPDCPGVPVKKGSVIFFSDEDHPAKIIKPRLDAHGADTSRVYILKSVQVSEGKEFFDLTRHLSGLEDTLKELPDCRMVVLDPLTAYMGRINANSNAEVRAALSPLATLAAKHRVTIIGINHHNKRQDLSYIYRGLGSTAFVAQARSVWGVVADKDNDGVKIFCPIKTNYCVEPTSLKYRIIDGVVTFEPEPWTGHIDDTIRNRQDRTKRIDEAAEWLQERLKSGSALSSTIFDEGADMDFNKTLLNRAKEKIGIKASRSGFGDNGQWSWSLPDDSE